MPDPAIDAIRAGLPYTEPTDGLKKGRSKAKVTFVENPHDPSGPPRRIIEVDSKVKSSSGRGFWDWLRGDKEEQWDTKVGSPVLRLR